MTHYPNAGDKAMMHCDTRWVNARLLTCADTENGLATQECATVGVSNGTIAYVGLNDDLTASETIDLEGRLLTPGLIDPHTHLIYGGDRATEFRQRLAGASYEEIARAGGGIVSTMRETRARSEDELTKAALPRLDALIAVGVTTVVVMSG
jgi:imidazolonepropionase